MSYHREGADMVKCRECGDKFNLNRAQRRKMEGGKYQPLCERCSNKLAYEDGIVMCTVCGEPVDIDKAESVKHLHHNGSTEKCVVCSKECTLLFLKSEQAQW